jgi:single-stranded-DNA-specific exonuclease
MSLLSWTGRRWSVADPDPARVEALAAAHAIPPLAARCLAGRAWPSADRPLEADLGVVLDHDPFGILGMARGVDRIQRAIRERERVLVVTDYDVDGTTSSLILQAALQRAGGRTGFTPQIDAHIPDRFVEGYGFSLSAARRAVQDGVQLVITADIGVRDHEAVALAREGGVDVLVCDHHLPDGERVPDAAHAVLCPPQAGCGYPNKALAACGLALKLSQALLQGDPQRESMLRSFLKLAAIGTVADVVDLSTPENRAIVGLGLQELSRGAHSPGLAALLHRAGLHERPSLGASDLGFELGPRINAAGRLTHANTIVQLLQARDPAEVMRLADDVEAQNQRRRGLQRALEGAAGARVPHPPPAFVLVWGDEDLENGPWHRGIVGIVAARLRDRLHRPVAVAAVDDQGIARGSIRSTPEVHAVDALESARGLLLRFGGHQIAAGFSAPAAHLPALAEALADWATRAGHPAPAAPAREADTTARPAELSRATVEAIHRIGPFGKGNPSPVIQLTGVTPREISAMGADRSHLRFTVDGVPAVWFGGAEHLGRLRAGLPVDLLVEADINHFRGRSTVQLRVQDARS